ncbi:ribosome maturation factor RimP [Telmatospirillum siberiense]|uniref:Ribosome maturation factor RimP n=1 Tax=Telmatospirillum siberiense TaxID=382514 RepID=A0A2N3PSE9_9PROT|nr:ribosome maturation factor RimP [Telmatospirillum siberiense]PKU23331.1 ribosome maturation factor RimP [Telmatospirillum siberiense]
MEIENRISAMVAPSLDAMGYELVRVLLQGRQNLTLQVMAERRDRQPMTVDDCAEISRSISAILDVEDPIAEAYTLEVSSPGIDRPLTRPQDFDRFAGFEAKVETVQPVEGRKRFRGQVMGMNDDSQVRLVVETGEIAIPLASIKSAKLVLTDALIAAATKAQEQ